MHSSYSVDKLLRKFVIAMFTAVGSSTVEMANVNALCGEADFLIKHIAG